MTLVGTLVVLGLTVGSLYALFAVSFGIIYNVTHVFHLAHGAVIAAAGYLIYVLVAQHGWPIWLGVAATVPVAAILGAGTELGFYRPLRRRGAPHVAFFLTSVGILIIGEGMFGTIFGPGAVTYAFLPLEPVALGPFSISNANLAMLSTWFFVALAVVYMLRTRTGRFMRAVADTPGVAAAVGIDIERTYLVSFAIGSALTVPGVVLYVWAQGLTPLSGLDVLLVASAAVIIGGRSGLLAGAVAAFGLGIVQAIVLVFLPTGWQDAVVFTLLFLALVLRPNGIFGRAFRW